MSSQAVVQSSIIRQAVSDEIASITAFDKAEQQVQAEAVQWVASGDDLFRLDKPDVPPKHLVSYFIMYDKPNRSLLLVDHKKSGLWLPTGGHVELNEHPRQTVVRECAEELATEAEFVSESPVFITANRTVKMNHPHIDVSLWYILKGTTDTQYKWDQREFNDARWWSFEAIQTQADGFDPGMHRFVTKLEQAA